MMTAGGVLATDNKISVAAVAFDLAEAEALLIQEAACLDERRWDDWLALFSADARFWVPAWKDYSSTTNDPETELSLIYYTERARLEERIWRLTSGQSLASVPLARTLHSITNVRLDPAAPDVVHANMVVHAYNPRQRVTVVNLGRYRVRLARHDGDLRIVEKYIVLLNDYLPSSIDIYTI
jgi:3-phenylpropionate/cinnamic acid dioxygenase small subunit